MRPIGIFDSGIGGVTVLKEILKVLPNENYIYYSDSKNNPYGDKSDNEILEICDNIVKYLINRDCKVIVIACNTASAKAVTYLRNKYRLENKKRKNLRDSEYMEKAEKLLYTEIGVVLNLTFEETKNFIINKVESMVA